MGFRDRPAAPGRSGILSDCRTESGSAICRNRLAASATGCGGPSAPAAADSIGSTSRLATAPRRTAAGRRAARIRSPPLSIVVPRIRFAWKNAHCEPAFDWFWAASERKYIDCVISLDDRPARMVASTVSTTGTAARVRSAVDLVGSVAVAVLMRDLVFGESPATSGRRALFRRGRDFMIETIRDRSSQGSTTVAQRPRGSSSWTGRSSRPRPTWRGRLPERRLRPRGGSGRALEQSRDDAVQGVFLATHSPGLPGPGGSARPGRTHSRDACPTAWRSSMRPDDRLGEPGFPAVRRDEAVGQPLSELLAGTDIAVDRDRAFSPPPGPAASAPSGWLASLAGFWS